MADLLSSVFLVIWAALIISVIMAGIWVFFSVRQTLTSTLVFDLLFTLFLIFELMNTTMISGDIYNNPVYLITFVTFFLNLTLISVILIEWRDREKWINPYVLWLKFALSIIGVYTCIPLGLYYLRLYYIPAHSRPESESEIPPPTAQPVPTQVITPPPELADRFSEWTFIGRGGFARVFRVRKKDGSYSALKIPLVHDMPTGKTFIAELQNWTHLSQENIVRILDFNILPIPFLEMELCDSSLANEKKPLTTLKAALVVFDICEGLKYCHSKGIIHRDLKPSNILIKEGVIKITDWGLSKVLSESLASTSQMYFSPLYAAPEQIIGTVKDARTDIWQTGVIFYELVTGRNPFQPDKGEENFVELLSSITNRDPAPPSVKNPDAMLLDGVIQKCLMKDPAERYANAGGLQDEIAAYMKQVLNEELTKSIASDAPAVSAFYCSELLLLCLKCHDVTGAYRYASELVNYAPGSNKMVASRLKKELKVQIKERGEQIPADLMKQAREMVMYLEPDQS